MTLMEEINDMKEKLNKSFENNEDYDKIYKMSTDLDKLIEKYYKITLKTN